MTIPEREFHYEEHFSEPSRASSSKPSSKLSTEPLSRFKSPFRQVSHEKQNVFWHSSMTSEPPSNFAPGLIRVLKKALGRSNDKGNTQRAWLCMDHAVLVEGEHWDRRWGCGYRNYLMACAALMDQQIQPMYFPLLDTPSTPGVRNLQILIERAWRDGYDLEGAEDMRRKLVDTSKWVGTAELYVAFTYKGIPAQLVDFSKLHDGVEPLLQWVIHYFCGGEPRRNSTSTTVGERLLGARAVVVTDRPPIILQHDGHSRTVVGVEQVKNGVIYLLTFDPGRRLPSHVRQTGLKYHDPARPAGSSRPFLPKKVPDNVLPDTVNSRKRKSPDPHGGSVKKKREGSSRDRDVIVIDDDEDENRDRGAKPSSSSNQWSDSDTLSPAEVLKVFRLDIKTLRKNKKYQILWFPMTNPLSEAEKLNRQIVTSEKIT
ncbi:peptidase family C78-domain-containing protein [Ganoderma leucocontextum]|nr:peptidase family C78-domain-containing protein [Ganoderma leucocontextum]